MPLFISSNCYYIRNTFLFHKTFSVTPFTYLYFILLLFPAMNYRFTAL